MTPEEILKKQFELRYNSQKYENSAVKATHEDFIIKAMEEYAKQESAKLLKACKMAFNLLEENQDDANWYLRKHQKQLNEVIKK